MDSGTSAFLSGLFGFFGVLISIPINAIFAWYLKRDEQNYQLKLNTILELRKKLIAQIEKRDNDVVVLQNDVRDMKKIIRQIWQRMGDE